MESPGETNETIIKDLSSESYSEFTNLGLGQTESPTDESILTWLPEVLVIGPGGPKGYLELGALWRLEKEDFFRETIYYTGVSAGAAIALFLVAGYSVVEIIRSVWDVNLLNDVTDLSFDKILQKGGLLTGKSVETRLTERIKQKFGFIPSMSQLYMATGKMLTVVTYNSDLAQTEYINKDSEPDISCVRAVMMSLALPILVQTQTYQGNDYVDGALGNPYPVDIHDDGATNILGVYIVNEKQTKRGLLRKAFNIIHASMDQLREKILTSCSDQCKHIRLTSGLMDTTGVTLRDSDKHEMIRKGFEEADIFLEQLESPEKYKILLGEDEEVPFCLTSPSSTPSTPPNKSEDIEASISLLDQEISSVLDLLTQQPNKQVKKEVMAEVTEDELDIVEDTDVIMLPVTPQVYTTLKSMRHHKQSKSKII